MGHEVEEIGNRLETVSGVAAEPLFGSVVHSLKWSYAASAATLVLQLAYTATVSRLVAPGAFGLVALGGVLLRFISYFSQLGLGSAVIQRPDLDERDVRVAFTASTVMGILAFCIAWSAAPWAARQFSPDPRLVAVSRALAGSFVISGVCTTAQAVLSRALRFRTLARVNVLAFGVGYLLIGLPLAMAGTGVWSLVGATLASSAVTAAGQIFCARHPMRPLYDGARLRSLTCFGGMVSIIGFFEFIAASLDTLAIGRFAGAVPLGNYSRASALVTPVERFGQATTSVLYSNFARVGSDRARTAQAYLSGLALLSALILPPAACLAASAPVVVQVLLGGKWGLAGGLLPPIALAIAIGLITGFSGSICEALGLLKPKLAIQAAHIGIVCLVVGVNVVKFHSAPIGFAYAWLAGEAVRQLIYAAWLQRVLSLPAGATVRRLAEAIFLAGLPALVVMVMGKELSLPPLLELLALSLAATVTLALACAAIPTLTVRREIRDRKLFRTVLGRTVG